MQRAVADGAALADARDTRIDPTDRAVALQLLADSGRKGELQTLADTVDLPTTLHMYASQLLAGDAR